MPADRPSHLRRAVRTARRWLADPLAHLPDRGRPATSHPTVGLVGYFGWGNYGDELFSEVFAEHLGPAMGLRNLLGPEHLGRPGRIRRGAHDSDAILIGGGDIVVPWLANRYWRDVFLDRPVFISGVGVPTWREATAEQTANLRRFFRDPAVRGIAVRDAGSAAWIRDNLAPSVPVEVTPDLVCGLSLPAVERPAGPPILGVTVRQRQEQDDFGHVRALCERATSMGFRVRRIVLATGLTRAADLQGFAGLGLDDTELVSTDDLSAISRAIGECTITASMKFHGVVVATMYGVPTLAMMPTHKTRSFLTTLGRADLLTNFNDPDLPDRFDPGLRPIDPAGPAALRREAAAHLAGLRQRILEVTAPGYPA